ncbi:MAG: peptidylprolyl isomerase, partial [Verrucomicrobiota bacterium]
MKNKAFSLSACRAVRAVAIAALFVMSMALNAAPVLQDLLTEPTSPTATPKVVPTIPVGKALIFPVSAYDDTGRPLTFTVQSSNPAIMARVRTGNPLLRINVSHAAGTDPAVDPAYSGTLVFQLFRDWTPMTAGFIGGFAQSGYLDNTKFQRLSDLNGNVGPAESLIYQGGGQANLGFNFENEFRAPLLFSGRGQLAMANAGTDSNTYKGTNASQFFITHGNLARSTPPPPESVIPLGGPRHLDFKHTVFGQLTHGWDVLNKFHNTPRDGDGPKVAVNIASAGVSAQYDDGTHIYTDAVLLLTAKDAGTATITVSVSDGVSEPVTSSFTATAKPDTNNSAPFIIPPENSVGPKDKIFSVPLAKAVDLEYDYISYASGLVNGSGTQGQSQQQAALVYLLGKAGFVGTLHLAFGITQFEMSYRGTVDGPAADFSQLISVDIGVGDQKVKLEPVGVYARPGTALTNATVAKFLDEDSHGGATAFTATINWGDGSAASTGTITPDTSRPVFAGALVMGTHTYAKAGSYMVTTTITGDKGFIRSVRGTATVSANA